MALDAGTICKQMDASRPKKTRQSTKIDESEGFSLDKFHCVGGIGVTIKSSCATSRQMALTQ